LLIASAAILANTILLSLGSDGWLNFFLWLLALAALGWYFFPMRSGWRPDARRLLQDLTLLSAVAAIGLFFRAYRIDDNPFGYWVDESRTAHNALVLAEERPFAPFGQTPLIGDRPGWVKTHNLYLYFCWSVQWLFGFGRLGVKMISVVPAVLAAPLLYLFARSFLSRPAALAAGGLLAVSAWHVTLSRWGWDEVLVTTLAIPVFHLACRAVATRDAAPAAFAGLLSGLSLYGYVAARLGAVAAVLFFLCQAAAGRDAWPWRLLGAFLLGLLASAHPLFVLWWGDPHSAWVRVNELSILPQVLEGDVAPLVDNVRAYLGMFHFEGDPNPRHGVPGEPVLHPIAGGLFVLGVAVSVWRLGRGESQACLLWAVGGLLGGILSDPRAAPNAYRVGLVAPACCLFCGMAIDVLLREVEGIRRAPRWLAGAAVVLVLAGVGADTFVTYFIKRPQNECTWKSTQSGAPARLVADHVATAVRQGRRVCLDDALPRFEIDFELERELGCGRGATVPRPDVSWLSPHDIATRRDEMTDAPGALLVVDPGSAETVRACFPAAPAQDLRTPFGEVVAVVFEVPAGN
jgi:hypothetical protein